MGKEQGQQATTDWLPEGWKVEVRRRGTGKVDKCYTDPSNEHKFKSKPEVLRFLKYTKTTCQPAALVEKAANIAEPPAELNKESGVKSYESSGHSLAAESEEKMVAGSQSEQHTMNKQSLITETGDLKNNDQSPSDNLKEGMKAAKPKSQKRKNVKGDNGPRRASRRIAGIEADDISLELPTVLSRPRRSAGKRSNHSEVDESNHQNTEEESNIQNPEPDSNNQNTGHEVNNGNTKPGSNNQSTEHESSNQSTEVVLDVPFSELLNDPCIEFAFKTLTGEMPLPTEDLNIDKPMVSLNEGSSSTLAEVAADQGPELFPPTDIWADPCFEFAVKTLTGDLPVDTNAILEAVSNPPPSRGVQPAPQAKNKQKSSTATALR